MREVVPCKECEPPKRKPGCHNKCKEYAEWKKAYMEKSEEIRLAKLRDYRLVHIDYKKRDKKR